MNGELETWLIECLDLLEHGEQIEKILARYPDDAAVLRPMLETAIALDELSLQPSNETQATSRQKFLVEAASLSQTTPHRRFISAPWQLILSLTSSVLALLLIGFGLVFASDAALPGQPLYMVKRGWENIRLRLTTDSESQRTLLELFNQKRLSEVERLIQTNQEAQVTFNGIIEAMDDGEWVVSGLKVSLDATTHINGTPALGLGTWITGFTRDGRLIASHIILDMEVGPALSVPTSTPEPTPQPPAGIPTPDSNVNDDNTNDNNEPGTDHSVNNSDGLATDHEQEEKGTDSSNSGADVLDDGSNNGHDIDDDNEDVTAGEDSGGNTDDVTDISNSSDNEEKPIEIEDSKNNSDDSRDDSPGEVDGTGDGSETNGEDEESLSTDSPSPPNDNNSTYDDGDNSNKDDTGNDGEDHSDPEDDDGDDDDEVDDDDDDDKDAD